MLSNGGGCNGVHSEAEESGGDRLKHDESTQMDIVRRLAKDTGNDKRDTGRRKRIVGRKAVKVMTSS